jgi:hypothetical protein
MLNLDELDLTGLAKVPTEPAAESPLSADDALIALWEADDLPGVEIEKSAQNIAFSLRRFDALAGEALEHVEATGDRLERIARALERIANAAEKALA